MVQRDYILRVIEEIGQALIALRNRILGREATAEEVGDELRAAARGAGLDLDLARVMTADSLHTMVAPGGEVEPARCWVLAEALYLDGLEAQLDGRSEEARSRLAKAGALFRLLGPGGAYVVGFPEAADRAAEITRRLEELSEESEGG